MTELELAALFRQAKAAYHGGDFQTARQLCDALLAKKRSDVNALMLAAEIARATERVDDELDFVVTAVKQQPKNPHLRDHLAKCYTFRGAFTKAMAQFEKALKLDPAMTSAVIGKAECYELQNKYDKARKLLAPFIAQPDPPPNAGSVFLRILLHEKALDEAVELGHRILDAGHPVDIHLRLICLHLAKAHERRGEYDEAMAMAERGNAMLAPPFDPAGFAQYTDLFIEVFTRERLAALPRPAEPSTVPIFVVGVPRCGSTLVERILASHPQVHGAGELRATRLVVDALTERVDADLAYPRCVTAATAEDVEAAGRVYLDAVTRLAPRATRIVDKNLGNYMHLGLIAVLFPAARVIHCHRDPLDTCLSCYFEPFDLSNAPFATELRKLGLYYRQYERLMRHWDEVLDHPRLDVAYEELVGDQESQTRRILEFCDLPWDDACLRFYEGRRHDRTMSYDQVRQPIYRSAMGRAERFGARLDPLRAALAGDEAATQP
jgi:tetratricopeptide (TPR) repeat protein